MSLSQAWTMDPAARTHYDVVLERDFLKLRGEKFQDFFSTLMEKRYRADFVRVRPMGSIGDQKNDGYLKTSQTVFQCYAPNELGTDATLKKIDRDFRGALAEWKEWMRAWTFVHNAWDGLGPTVLKKLLKLRARHRVIDVTQWGFPELRRLTFELDDDDIASFLGPPLTTDHLRALGFADIQDVLGAVQWARPPVDADVSPVPPGKLAHNRLSDAVADFLRMGMRKVHLVRSFFEARPDPTLGDRIAAALKGRYLTLRSQGFAADQIFFELQEFIGGGGRGVPQREAAVITMLAYYFEQCDIFERPPGEAA